MGDLTRYNVFDRIWHTALITIGVMWLSLAASAHEMTPSIGDLGIDAEAGTFSVTIRTNLEALVAGISPTHDDTNESPNAALYNALREAEPDAFRDSLKVFEPIFLGGVAVQIDGAPAPVEMIDVTIPEVGDTELARQSQLIIGGQIPEGAEALTFAWDASFGQIVFRALNEDRSGYVSLLQGAERSEPVPIAEAIERSWSEVFVDYIGIGFEHILPLGLDHILFVVGLFLLSTQLWPLLAQVTSFTLAHTVTLALGLAGIVNIPGSIVEPLIALSIVYVGVENILTSKLSPWRPIVVFIFGLLHGLGFAGVLGEYGIPEGHFASALIGFNIGVEFGQLTVILACFLAVGFWFGRKPWYRQAVIIPGSVIVSLVGLYWFVERTIL